MAARLASGDYDQLHHFIADGVWDAAPLESELLVQVDRLLGGKDAVLVIDDTAMPKKGDRSVGVAPQYASSLGKTANCQTLVSLTLARGEVPVMVALRLFVPESWTGDPVRSKRAGASVEHCVARTKLLAQHCGSASGMIRALARTSPFLRSARSSRRNHLSSRSPNTSRGTVRASKLCNSFNSWCAINTVTACNAFAKAPEAFREHWYNGHEERSGL